MQLWLRPLLRLSETITQDWINNHYSEAALKPKQHNAKRVVQGHLRFHFANSKKYREEIQSRRRQQVAFAKIAGKLRSAVRECADGKMNNSDFWRLFWDLWAKHESRFQGSGLQFSGKSADWQQACKSVVAILDFARSHRNVQDDLLDGVVSSEIDRLAAARNPTRGAWLSEMLCHFFPVLYPIRNSPVRKWLAYIHWRGRRGASEGQQYTELAQQLRDALRTKPAGAENLAELERVSQS